MAALGRALGDRDAGVGPDRRRTTGRWHVRWSRTSIPNCRCTVDPILSQSFSSCGAGLRLGALPWAGGAAVSQRALKADRQVRVTKVGCRVRPMCSILRSRLSTPASVCAGPCQGGAQPARRSGDLRRTLAGKNSKDTVVEPSPFTLLILSMIFMAPEGRGGTGSAVRESAARR